MQKLGLWYFFIWFALHVLPLRRLLTVCNTVHNKGSFFLFCSFLLSCVSVPFCWYVDPMVHMHANTEDDLLFPLVIRFSYFAHISTRCSLKYLKCLWASRGGGGGGGVVTVAHAPPPASTQLVVAHTPPSARSFSGKTAFWEAFLAKMASGKLFQRRHRCLPSSSRWVTPAGPSSHSLWLRRCLWGTLLSFLLG